MSTIKILPENLSNKIAAGEVVERPASVVKELVENALDAGSDRIVVEIEKGGRTLIQVADNGVGMIRDDALLCIERYATSKIYSDDDLFSISTLGFRGEALPSIASVSRFRLVTRGQDADVGAEIIVDGGTVKRVADTGAPVGTMVSVRQLFFNTPARRKFMKTVNTEMGHIVETLSGIALGWPEVRMRLIHNGREIKHWPGVANPRDRVVDVLGRDVDAGLHELNYEDETLSIRGWTSSPTHSRSTSRGIYIYVNNRIVKDRVVQHALFQGYSGRIVKGQFPIAALFIRVPNEKVDVNVHPAKNEVRFAEQKKVHDSVRRCVAQALDQADRKNWSSGYRPPADFSDPTPLVSEKGPGGFALKEPPTHDAWVVTNPQAPITDDRSPATDSRPPAIGHMPPNRDGILPKPAEQQALWSKKRFKDLQYVGQFHDTYLIFESDEGLVIIDQHAAHERIMYEHLQKRSHDRLEKQVLLIPETMDLSYREAAVMAELSPGLQDLAFDVEPFGGGTFVVKAVPAILDGCEIKPLMLEMVDAILESGHGAVLENALDDCLKIMACHGAIRANQKLTLSEIERMLEQLDACDHPSNCPHGRPTWINWPTSFLEKSFKRIV
ncbi:MAG: DNA mismatch repair endonuclease MutL [Thermodesulfobacteriota bacterium]